MEQTTIDALEDGSASPDSADENIGDVPASEDQSLSKNRSKRKPSKTQIKHIAQGALASAGINGQVSRESASNETVPNTQNLSLEKRKSVGSGGSSSPSNTHLKDENCDTDTSKYGTHSMEDLFNDVTQGIYIDSHIQQNLPVQGMKTQKKSMKNSSEAFVTSPNTSARSPSGRPAPCYPCGICGKVFRVPSRYDSHMLGHSKGKPFCCNTCGKMFVSQEKLDRHLPVHNCDRHAAFTCETCGKVCVNWRAYLYHMKAKHTESGGKRFSCTLCGRQFHSGQRLRNHMASHEVGKNHCCHVCGKLFESSKKLAIHSLVHNLSSMHDQNLQCGDCGRQYSEWIAFKQHMKTHGSDGVHYPCGICGETFPTQYEKEKHKRVHKQVQCGICHRYFRSSSVLSIHLRIHTGEKPYNCGLCEKEFSQLSVLKVHMRLHMNENRYDCKICTAIFTDVMDYFKHYITHFEDGNLHCEICGKAFDNIKKKNRHMAAHQDRTDRQCHVCGKEFGRVSHLEAHMLCHSDQIPLMCKVCGKMFSSQEVLTAHYSIHVKTDMSSESVVKVEDGPLFCGLCGKMFKDQEYLNKHMKRHEVRTQEIKREDTMLDEDVVEVEKGKFSCHDCGKTFNHDDHLQVHRREHTGEKPHICVMCGQSFKLRKLLLEHGLSHKQKDFGNISIDHSNSKTFTAPSSLPKSHGESDSGSGSETDTDCDHEENVRQSKGKHSKTTRPVIESSSAVPSCFVSSTFHGGVQPHSIHSSHQHEHNLHLTGVKYELTQNMNTSVSLFPSVKNSNESHASTNQIHERFTAEDPSMSNNNVIGQGIHHPLPIRNDTSSSNLSMRPYRPAPHMSVGMHMSSHQDFKTDVSSLPMSYSRAYMTSHSMNPVPHHSPSLHPNFHGPSGRFHTDLQHNTLPNFQLLPQTAFHEQTYHM